MALPLRLPAVLMAALVLAAPAAVLTAPAGPAGATTSAYSPPSGANVMAHMEGWVMTHPLRMHELSTMHRARADLAENLSALGLHVQMHEYGGGVNIVAYQNGTSRPNEWIVLSAHYDTHPGTVYGAWDDGAGVALLLEMARSGATRTFNRTVAYAFFDDEEGGLIGSDRWVDAHWRKVYANLNFDPPGLNWPCADATGPLPVKVSFNDQKVAQNKPGYARVKNAVMAALDAAGVPPDARDASPAFPIATVMGFGAAGGSDHESFDERNVPNAFIGSLPAARVGEVKVLTYALHTPTDDLAAMVARCGGEDLLEQAFGVQGAIARRAIEILDGP